MKNICNCKRLGIVGEGVDVELRKNKREPPDDGTVLCLDCGGCYTNLHVIKPNTTTHTHTHTT